MAFNQLFLHIEFKSNTIPYVTVDEIEKMQRQRTVTHSAVFDFLIQEKEVNRCNGCAISHPKNQNQYSCLMMDSEDGWFYCHDDLRDKTNHLRTAERICNVLGLKLGKSWEAYVSKLPWTSMYLTSRKLESLGETLQPKNLQESIRHALYHGLCGLISTDYNAVQTSDEDIKVDPMGNFARKEEGPMDVDIVVDGIENKLCI